MPKSASSSDTCYMPVDSTLSKIDLDLEDQPPPFSDLPTEKDVFSKSSSSRISSMSGDTLLPYPATIPPLATDKPRKRRRLRRCAACCVDFAEDAGLWFIFIGGISLLVAVAASLVGAGFSPFCSYIGLYFLRHKEEYVDADTKAIYIASATGGAVLAVAVVFVAWVVCATIKSLLEGSLSLVPWSDDDDGSSIVFWAIVTMLASVPVGVCGQAVGYYILQGRLSGGLDLHLAFKLDGVGYPLALLALIGGTGGCCAYNSWGN